jgi:hypothetical protein
MATKRTLQLLSMAVICLLFTSCSDSQAPLSDPVKSKADQRLAGVWRLRNDDGSVTYYHVGRVGDKLPASVMRVAGVQHRSDGMTQFDELLLFPTAINEQNYLNVCDGKDEQMKRLEQQGWTPETVTSYLLLRYHVTGDALSIQWIDGDAKKRAVEAGTIKGKVEKDQDGNARAMFTDTTENLAKFVAEAGDDLFSKNSLKLERVK